MPLVLAAYLAFAAGLLTGFGGALVPGLLIGGGAAALGIWRRDGRWPALGALIVAGVLVAHHAARREARCVAALAGVGAWTVRLDGSAAPGAYVRGHATGRGCSASCTLIVRSGRAPAGALVRVTGEGGPMSRGLLVRGAKVEPRGGPGRLRALRTSAGVAIDSAFREDAPLARALLVADTRSISPEVRDRFAAAGLVHVLSISGLHVAIIAGAILLVLRALRLSRTAAELAALAATAGYVLMIGAPAPAVRAGAMLGVGVLSRMSQRPVSPWAALALGGLLPLVEPRVALDLGYQLSMAGMAALVAARVAAARHLAGRLSGWRLSLARELGTSVLASAVTGPLVAWSFGRISLVAPLANLAAAPLVTVLQPMLFLALLCAPAPALARFVADASHPLLLMLDRIAAAGAALPFASLSVAPTLGAAALAGTAALALLIACASRAPAGASLIALAAIGGLAWLPMVPARTRGAELHLIDVGQGDAVALRTDRGRWILMDAGRGWTGGDAGRSTVIPYLRRRGGDLALFVLSHPHADHVGGAASVLEALRPPAYRDAAYVMGSELYRRSLDAARRRSVAWRRVAPGDSMRVDGVLLTFLAPDSAWASTLDDPNEASTVMIARFGAVRFLLVGDAERAEEEWLLERWGDGLRADVLKVGHHGSRTSSGQRFIDAVRPRLALISVGAANGYGHPSPEVVRRLSEANAVVLRTDHVGSIVARTDGRTITLEADGTRWELSPSSDGR